MEKFTIHITFSNDGGSLTEDHTSETLGSAIQRLTRGPAAAMGMIEEVKVVDLMDCTNFEWRKGRLVFPIPGVHI